MTLLRQHDVVLEDLTSRGLHVKLRPMTEDDWDILHAWNSDPEVLYFSEGDDVTGRTLQDVQMIYRGVSANAFCFIIEADSHPVGECWLQRMNLDEILAKHPRKDCRRIDLTIGEKSFWGKGIGTAVISLLTGFGFVKEKADLIFACHIADYNQGSLRVFKKLGYEDYLQKKAEPGRKYKYQYFLYLSRERFFEARN